MNKRIYFLSIIGFFIVIVLSFTAMADDEFLSSTFNGKPIFIPKAYDQGSVLNPEINIELVQVGVIYPVFSPSQKSRKELVAEKKAQNYIHINVNPIIIKGLTFSEFAENGSLKYSTQKFTEKKYGLDKTAEPYKDFQLQSDMWVERVDGKPVSYISCTVTVFDAGNITELQVEPRDYLCSQRFFSNNIYYEVQFHNSLLPNWKEIQDKSIELFESFSTKELALNYLNAHSKK